MNQFTFTVAVIMACANALEVSFEETNGGSATIGGMTGTFSSKYTFDGKNDSTALSQKERTANEGKIVFDTAPRDNKEDVYMLWSCAYNEDLEKEQEITCHMFTWADNFKISEYNSSRKDYDDDFKTWFDKALKSECVKPPASKFNKVEDTAQNDIKAESTNDKLSHTFAETLTTKKEEDYVTIRKDAALAATKAKQDEEKKAAADQKTKDDAAAKEKARYDALSDADKKKEDDAAAQKVKDDAAAQKVKDDTAAQKVKDDAAAQKVKDDAAAQKVKDDEEEKQRQAAVLQAAIDDMTVEQKAKFDADQKVIADQKIAEQKKKDDADAAEKATKDQKAKDDAAKKAEDDKKKEERDAFQKQDQKLITGVYMKREVESCGFSTPTTIKNRSDIMQAQIKKDAGITNFLAHVEASTYKTGTDDPEGFESKTEEDSEEDSATTVLASFAAVSAAIFAIAF